MAFNRQFSTINLNIDDAYLQAHRMDTPDLSDRPHVSSVVDDVFYLLKLVLNRALTSGSLATIRAIRENVSKIIERDYLGVLQKKMDAVYSGGGAAIGLLGTNLPGANKEAEKEKREKELRISYSVGHPYIEPVHYNAGALTCVFTTMWSGPSQ
jgi:hypothetical protein